METASRLEPLPTPEDSGDSNGSEGLESVLVGKSAPPDRPGNAKRQTISSADYKGKVLIFDFWASWCGPCLQTMPQVDAVAKEFAAHGVVLVGINLEETRSEWSKPWSGLSWICRSPSDVMAGGDSSSGMGQPPFRRP